MARSLQIGLRALAPNISAVMVALADQPQIEPATVEKILQRWREKRAPVIAPFLGEQRGHPLLFDRAVWDDLLKLPFTANPRDFLRTVERIEKVLVETDSILKDIDTLSDYQNAGHG
jgi:CTP:molybdopterin cytidylyltransferase MocA